MLKVGTINAEVQLDEMIEMSEYYKITDWMAQWIIVHPTITYLYGQKYIQK